MKKDRGQTIKQSPGATAKSFRGRELLERAFYRAAGIQFGLVRLLLRISTQPKLFELTLRNYVKRPEWLYTGDVKMDPVGRFSFREIKPSDDRLLCERLLAAYQQTIATAPASVSGIWSSFIQKHYRDLLAALERQSPGELSILLSGMFQHDFLYGISSAAFGLRAGTFIRMKLVEELQALAEALGLVRAEAPEQGVMGYSLSAGLDKLVRRIEDHLGMAIDFPDVGGAYGIEVGGHLITPESPEHIYVAHRVKETIQARLASMTPVRVLEIGAGFGGTAYWLMRLHPIAHYTIVDLPLMNVCQGYFLGKVFGESTVRLFGEPDRGNDIKVHVLPAQAKDQAGDFNFLLNENSMPEIPEATVADYLQWARQRKPKLFYSYNQEAFSPGSDNVPQTLVPNVVATVGGFKRLSRNYSWIRRGYVEEVYALAGD